jgi:hypothetical protein
MEDDGERAILTWTERIRRMVCDVKRLEGDKSPETTQTPNCRAQQPPIACIAFLGNSYSKQEAMFMSGKATPSHYHVQGLFKPFTPLRRANKGLEQQSSYPT